MSINVQTRIALIQSKMTHDQRVATETVEAIIGRSAGYLIGNAMALFVTNVHDEIVHDFADHCISFTKTCPGEPASSLDAQRAAVATIEARFGTSALYIFNAAFRQLGRTGLPRNVLHDYVDAAILTIRESIAIDLAKQFVSDPNVPQA